MLTFIPSMARSHDQSIMAGPVVDMSERARRNTMYVVPEDEVLLYRQSLDRCGFTDVGVLACPARGIAATRLAIGETASEMGYTTFVMLDDDIRFLVRKSEDAWNLRQADSSEVDEMFDHVEEWLNRGFAHVGVSAREGNNVAGVGGRDLRNECTRTIRFLAYRTDDFLGVEHGRVEVMEDFDVNLQLLEQGKPNVSLFWWSQGQKMTNAPGGCSTYRSHEVHERSAHRLAELHPRYVKLRQKKNKTDADGFGTRTEVTIMWKQCYEENRK